MFLVYMKKNEHSEDRPRVTGDICKAGTGASPMCSQDILCDRKTCHIEDAECINNFCGNCYACFFHKDGTYIKDCPVKAEEGIGFDFPLPPRASDKEPNI